MSDHDEAAAPSARDGGAVGPAAPDGGEFVNPALVAEYLVSLQSALDAVQDRAERLAARVETLEGERAVLRDRLAAARAAAAAPAPSAVTRARGVLSRALGTSPADVDDRDDAADGDAATPGGEHAAARSGDAAVPGGEDAAAPSGDAAVAAADGVASGDGVASADGGGAATAAVAAPAGASRPAPTGPTAVLPVVGRLGPPRWPSPAPSRDLRIAVVADEFTTTSLRYEAAVVPLRSDDGPETLRRSGADLLFVESAYTGPARSWQRRIARFGAPHPDVLRLLDAARTAGVPSLFWNKEDPVNSDWFTTTAALFDHVFTVDEGLVDHYRHRFGHDRVHVLPFAAQPAIHRPPDDPAERTGPILFAGTWFATKHPERRAQMAMLLDPARERGLHVLSRQDGDDPRYAWPERFAAHVVGSLPYPLAVEATRRHRVVVNVNTVTDSPTMCARRVFELAACATPVVSGPSLAVERLVPQDAIRVAHTRDEAAAAYDELLGDPAAAAGVGDAARQWVLDGHTWTHRVATIVDAVG